MGDDERGSERAPLRLGLLPHVVHLLGLDSDEALHLGEHPEERRRGAVLDGAVAAAEAHGLERAAVQAPRPREAPHQRDVQPGTPRHRHPRLERIERTPAHLRAPLPAISFRSWREEGGAAAGSLNLGEDCRGRAILRLRGLGR